MSVPKAPPEWWWNAADEWVKLLPGHEREFNRGDIQSVALFFARSGFRAGLLEAKRIAGMEASDPPEETPGYVDGWMAGCYEIEKRIAARAEEEKNG